MERVKVTITTDVPIAVKVVRNGGEKIGLSKLLCDIKNAGVAKNESQREKNARNYGT